MNGADGPLPATPSPPTRARRAGRLLWRLYRAPMFSPIGFLVRAGILTLVFVALHLAGLRHHVSVLSGSLATGSLPGTVSGALGIVYVCAYFAAVLAVPILVLAAAILAICQTVLPRKR